MLLVKLSLSDNRIKVLKWRRKEHIQKVLLKDIFLQNVSHVFEYWSYICRCNLYNF